MRPGTDPTDVLSRRRTEQLRRALALAGLPDEAGVRLLALAPALALDAEQRVRTHIARFAALPPSGQALLTQAVRGGITEFARLAANRLPAAPGAEALFLLVGEAEGRSGWDLDPVQAALQTARAVVAAECALHEAFRPCSAQLMAALDRYADLLHARAAEGHRRSATRTSGATGDPAAARHASISDVVREQWGPQVRALFLTLVCVDQAERDRPPDRAPRPGGLPAAGRVLVLAGPGHDLLLSPAPLQVTGAHRRTVLVLPAAVRLEGVPRARDAMLLVLELLRAGLARPPSPVTCLPDDGLVHLDGSPDAARRIAELVTPLMSFPPRRRLALARTLRARLTRPGSAHDLAAALGCGASTVRAHLRELDALFPGLVHTESSTLGILAALRLLVPLWEQEAAGRPAAAEAPLERCSL